MKLNNFFLYCVLFILNFFLIRFIYMKVFYQYTMTLFYTIYYKNNPKNDFWFVLLIILFLTYILTSLIYQIIKGNIKKRFLYIVYASYFLALIYFLFFKTIGISDYNFNIFSIIYDLIYGDSLIVLMNILFFIPLGFLIRFNKKSSFIFIVSIFCVEILQYFLHLGIFDIADIILNYIGFTIGTIIIDYIKVKFKLNIA